MTAPSVVRPVPDGDNGRYALNMVWDNANSQWVPSTTGGLASTQVQGTAADGAPAVANPVQMGGVDGAGNVQAIATDTSGDQIVVGPNAGGAAASGGPLAMGGVNKTTKPTYTDGQRTEWQHGTRGSGAVTLFGADTTLNVWVQATGTVGIAAGSFGSLFTQSFPCIYNGTTWDVQSKSNLTARLLTTAATVNNTLVKNAAGNLHKITMNVAVAGKFLKLYNKASTPAAGTDTPVMTIALPATGAREIDFGPNGHYFGTGIGFAITGAAADADTTAVAAGDITALNITYS